MSETLLIDPSPLVRNDAPLAHEGIEDRGLSRILVVSEDRRLYQEALRALKGDGHFIYWASDKDRALDLLADLPVDLVIADLIKPAEDGKEVFGPMRRMKWLRRSVMRLVKCLVTPSSMAATWTRKSVWRSAFSASSARSSAGSKIRAKALIPHDWTMPS